MRSYTENLYAKFEMSNGSELRVEWSKYVAPGDGFNYDDEIDYSEPTIYIDGDDMTDRPLPRGLDKVVAKLYESSGIRV